MSMSLTYHHTIRVKRTMRKINANPQNNSNEFLLNNHVDEDVQAILRPINFLMSINFLKKYRIRDNFITSNSFFSNSLSLCVTLILMLLHIRQSVVNVMELLSLASLPNKYQYFYLIFDTSVFCIGFIMNFIINVCSNEKNVDFVLYIQDVHTLTKTYKNNSKELSFGSWCFVLAYISYHASITLYHRIYFNYWTFRSFITFFYNANIIYAFRLIKLIRYELVLWINLLQREYESCYIEMDQQDTTYGDHDCERLYKAFFKILRAFDNYKEVHKGMVLFQVIGTFLYSIIFMQVGIELIKTGFKMEIILSKMGLALYWTLICLCLHIILAVELEKFYVTMEESKAVCNLILSNGLISDKKKKLYKNILRAYNAGFTKMTAYGLFTIDAKLPVHLIFAISTYTVVILQFAFQ